MPLLYVFTEQLADELREKGATFLKKGESNEREFWLFGFPKGEAEQVKILARFDAGQDYFYSKRMTF